MPVCVKCFIPIITRGERCDGVTHSMEEMEPSRVQISVSLKPELRFPLWFPELGFACLACD